MEVPDYELPGSAVAQVPVEPRDSARLLDALDPAGTVAHRHVRDLPALLRPGDVVVLNTTRVMPARLRLFKSTGGQAEVLLLEPESPDRRCWSALVRPGRRLAPGTPLAASPDGPGQVEVGERLGDGRRIVRFLADPEEVVAGCGTVALPPYIRTPLGDPDRYQTVYADRSGSVAAPTAGLHLTAAVLERCRDAGADVVGVDLAVGMGTFKPVTAGRAEDHPMHAERYRIPAATWDACRGAQRVVAIGTTTVRALETAAATGELAGSSNLYIRGDYRFAVVDVLLTNFHLPRSTLLLMLESFCGPRWRTLYATAQSEGYRFLSFGDAMIVGRQSEFWEKGPPEL